VSISHLFRKSALGRRTTHLAVVVFPDEGSAFQAYRLLHYHGISPENLAIVGQGYSSPERVGLMTPLRIVVYKALMYGAVSSVVGAVLGAASIMIWKLQHELALILPTCALLSGLAGIVLGALFGLFGEGTTASVYRHHLRQGRYLLMMEGSENLVRLGQEVLGCYSAPSPH